MGIDKNRLLAGVGFSAGQAQGLEDVLTGVGSLATQPSGGGTSLTTTGNIFEYFNQTGVGNGADTTEDTLKSFAIPANAFDVAGRGIRIYAWGSYANNTNTKAAKLYFGTTSVAAVSGNNVSWALEMTVGKAASNQQVYSAQNITGTSHGGVSNGTINTVDTAAITVKVTGQDTTSANANAIVLNGMFAQWMN